MNAALYWVSFLLLVISIIAFIDTLDYTALAVGLILLFPLIHSWKQIKG